MKEPKTVQFNLRNNSLSQVDVTLFDVNTLSVGLGSSISLGGSSVNYDFFVQTLNNDPKLIYDILIKMPQRFLINPLNVVYTDANGESTTTPYLPNTDIDVYQKSPNRGSVKFDDGLILNVNTQLVITLPPIFEVILLIDYTEFLKSDMLDAVIYNDKGKAKYLINQSLSDGKISAKKYWGSKNMPKELNLNKDWVNDLKGKFSKVEIIEYDQPKLAGGNIQMRNVYQNLFGFKKQVKAMNIKI
jgi:hypothetical protein